MSATCLRLASMASACSRSRSSGCGRGAPSHSGRAVADFVRDRRAVPAWPRRCWSASETWDSDGVPAFWEFWGKIDGLMLAVSIYYNDVAYALLGLAMFAALCAAWTNRLHFHPVGWALLVVGAMVYLAMPRALFAAHLADQRLPIALAFMLAACLRVDLPGPRARAAFAAAADCCCWRCASPKCRLVWNRLARGPVAAYESVKLIDRGSRVLVVHGDRSQTGLISDLGLLHIASLATIERSALVTTNFTVERASTSCRCATPYRPFVDTQDGVPPSIPYFSAGGGRRGRLLFQQVAAGITITSTCCSRCRALPIPIRHGWRCWMTA